DLVDRNRPPELPRHGRELGVLDAAGSDPLRERRRVEVDVERVAVRGDPFGDVDADRGDLARGALQPDAGEAFDPRRLEPERRESPDDRLLEITAVLLDVLAVPRQVEDRVANELPRAVVGGLAAAVGLDDLDV